ncbi:Arc family DNA-binding protein [Sinorhizobium meliloti]|nr:Arc family DNA-binding protein [Sinorhizobium meliloti]MDW9749305.1 Arc family DNA-binding protein [Sinorhizobium meliloti]
MARKQFPSDKQDQFMVRMPKGMRDALKEIAAGNGRSLNAEIIDRLNNSLNWPELSVPPALYEQVIQMPFGVLEPLEKKLQEMVVSEVSNALLSHQISQKNLLSRFEEFIEYAPKEDQPRLREELRDLFIRVGIYRQPQDEND